MKTIVRIKLLEEKYIELREFELFKSPLKVIYCKSDDYRFCSHTSDPYMVLSIAQQKKGVVINTQRSKFYPYRYYRMYKFLWKPVEVKLNADVAPQVDESVKSRLADVFFLKHPEMRRKYD